MKPSTLWGIAVASIFLVVGGVAALTYQAAAESEMAADRVQGWYALVLPIAGITLCLPITVRRPLLGAAATLLAVFALFAAYATYFVYLDGRFRMPPMAWAGEAFAMILWFVGGLAAMVSALVSLAVGAVTRRWLRLA